jgi:hypothetical protein
VKMYHRYRYGSNSLALAVSSESEGLALSGSPSSAEAESHLSAPPARHGANQERSRSGDHTVALLELTSIPWGNMYRHLATLATVPQDGKYRCPIRGHEVT